MCLYYHLTKQRERNLSQSTPAARKLCVDKIRRPAARQSLCRENPNPGPAKNLRVPKIRPGEACPTRKNPTAPARVSQ